MYGTGEGPLCCCEYENIKGERSHILACCCNCEEVDMAFDRCITCKPSQSDQMQKLFTVIEDRCRIPGILSRGAIRIPLDIAFPATVIPLSLVLATIGPVTTMFVGFAAPILIYLFNRCYCRSGLLETPGRSSHRSRVYYSWSITSAVTLYIIYITIVVGFREVLLWETLLFSSLFVVVMLMQNRIRNNPGFVPKTKSTTDVVEGHMLTYCTECKIERPERSVHCYQCKACVLIRDHHCPWIDCCIGANNHQSFILTLFIAIVTGYYGTNLALTSVCTPEMYLDWFLLPADCRFIYADFPTALCFVAACYAFICTTLLLLLFLYQCLLISHNVTMLDINRSLRNERLGCLKIFCLLYSHSYNRGFALNWMEFLLNRRSIRHVMRSNSNTV